MSSERLIVHAALLDPGIIAEVGLRRRDFSDPDCARVWEAMVELPTVSEMAVAERAGMAVSDLLALADIEGEPELAHTYAAEIRRAASERSARDVGDRLHRGLITPAEALTELEEHLATGESGGPASVSDTIDSVLVDIAQGSGSDAIPTGIRAIDERVEIIAPTWVTVVAGRPGEGKSALAKEIARHVSLAGHPVGIWSYEMSKTEIYQRMLSSMGDIPGQHIKQRLLRGSEHDDLRRAADELRGAHLWIDDECGSEWLEFEASVRRWVYERRTHGSTRTPLVILDYLQLLSVSGMDRWRQLGHMTRQAKRLARQLHCSVMLLSQIGRPPKDAADNRRPRLSDLRESGNIEQDADVVCMLHHPEGLQRAVVSGEADAVLIVAKNRHGSVEDRILRWIPSRTSFR